MMSKLAKIKILNNDLICQVCKNNEWQISTMRVEAADGFLKLDYKDQVRYLFECPKCGNVLIFGMVYDWEEQTQNIQICYLDD